MFQSDIKFLTNTKLILKNILSLFFLSISLMGQGKTFFRGVLLTEAIASYKFIDYNYNIRNPRYLNAGEFRNTKAPGLGLQCRYLNPKKFWGLSVSYRNYGEIKTGFKYLDLSSGPNPNIPDEIFVKLKQREFAAHLYYNLHIPGYFDFLIGPEVKKVTHQFISERMRMRDGSIKDRNTFKYFQGDYKKGPLYEFGMKAAVVFDVKAFHFSLNVSVAQMNRHVFEQLQKSKAISTTLDLCIGYKLLNK